MSLINLWLERLERSMGGKRNRNRNKGNNLMAKQHKKSKWCSRSAYLCKNPKHYTWRPPTDELDSGLIITEYWNPHYSHIRVVNRGGDMSDDDALQSVVEKAFLSGDRTCYKALCILAFNNPEYSSWQDACLANYERIVNSPIPNRKLKRQV